MNRRLIRPDWHAVDRTGQGHAYVRGNPRSLCGAVLRTAALFDWPATSRCPSCRDALAADRREVRQTTSR